MKNKVFFTYEIIDGEIKIKSVVGIYNGEYIEEEFDELLHGELLDQLMLENNIQSDDYIEEAKGFFNVDELTEEKIIDYFESEQAEVNEEEPTKETSDESQDDNSNDVPVTDDKTDDKTDDSSDTPAEDLAAEDEYTDQEPSDKDFGAKYGYVEDEEKDSEKGKRVVAGILAAGAVIGGLSLLHSCNHEQIKEAEQGQTIEDLLKKMTPAQREFFQASLDAVDTFNTRTTEDGNFKLNRDKSTLQLSFDEAVALNVVLNNYSGEDLYEIFGTVNLDTTNVMNLARSAYSKLSTYYMNATKPSGLAEMIKDESARKFFEKHESAVVEFNNNPSTDLSDKVIKGLYYDYVVGGTNAEYTKIGNDSVAWLATSASFGFELANRNVSDYLSVHDTSDLSTKGLKLREITGNKLFDNSAEEVKIGVMDEVDHKSLCATSTKKNNDKIAALRMRQQIEIAIVEANAKNDLVEGLRENGNISLANKVFASGISSELLEEISEVNSTANELVEDYNAKIESLKKKEAQVVALRNLANDKYEVKDLDVAELVNNRFRNVKGKDYYVGTDDKGNDVYDGDALNKLPADKKDDFIKDNGVIVDKNDNIVDKEKVEKDDLTKEEQDKVINIEAALKEIEVLRNDLIERGVYDALDYTEEIGAYKYDGDLIIPFNNQKLDTTNMSLFNIAAYDAAFGNKDINVNDQQIQERMNNDAKDIEDEVKSLSENAKNYLEDKYGSDWEEDFLDESYEYGYAEQIKGSLKSAEELAPAIRKEAEEAYNKIQDLNKEQEDVKAPVVQENQNTNNGYDPNLDPNYGTSSEEQYVPKVPEIDEPAYYVPNSDLEEAFGKVASKGSK